MSAPGRDPGRTSSSDSGGVTDRLRGLVGGEGLPDRQSLPRWVAPLPAAVENLGLHLAPLVVAVNLAGTAFGFWYYRFQFSVESPFVWPLVPDSPLATLFAALAFFLWWRGRPSEYVTALAFFGCWKLGLWTPYVLAVFADGFLATVAPPGLAIALLGADVAVPAMYGFLFVSHLAMVVQAFVLHRISGFPVRAVVVAVAWYGLNDVVDYFIPVVGSPHHTLLPAQEIVDGLATHPSPTHEIAAAGAVVLTLSAAVVTLSTRVYSLELAVGDRRGGS
jgi:uncharacterized membrane protein YpjA